jgi:hypothetical protein
MSWGEEASANDEDFGGYISKGEILIIERFKAFSSKVSP